MVRRWSSITALNINLSDFSKFTRVFKVNTFRSSVNYKRFFVKYTKFKRKSLARWKHRSNWVIYLNIIKFWVEDYRFVRQTARYQFSNKIFLNNVNLYDFNYIKVRYARVFSTFPNFFTTSLSKRFYMYFSCRSLFLKESFFKNANLVKGFLPPKFVLENDTNVLPISSSYENLIYTPSNTQSFDFMLLYSLFFEISMKHVVEIYKILIFLNYYILRR